MDLEMRNEKELTEQSLQDHFRRRQMTEFHKKILDSTGKDGFQGFSEDFFRAYGQIIIRLPYGQLIQVWKVFASRLSEDNLFATQLFCSFFDHLRVADETSPTNLQADEDELVGKTKDLLKTLSNYGSGSLAFLRLTFSFGNFLLLKSSYSLDKKPKLNSDRLNSVFDLYPIHDYFEGEFWVRKVKASLKAEDSEIPSIAYRLLLQKTSAILLHEQSTRKGKRRRTYQETSAQLFGKLSELVQKKKQLVVHLIPYISFLTPADMHLIATVVLDEFLKKSASESLVKSVICSLQDNSSFQSAILSSIIANANEFCQDTTVKSIFAELTKEDLFDSIDDEQSKDFVNICYILKEQEIDLNIDFDVLSCLLDKLSYLPLGYLQPKTQLRCSLFLTTLLLSSSSGKKWKKILPIIVNYLIEIIEGVRHIWLFKFFNPVDFITILIIKGTSQKSKTKPEYDQRLLSLIIERSLKDHNLNFRSLKRLHKLLMEKLVHPEVDLFFSTVLLNEVNDRLARIKKEQNRNDQDRQEPDNDYSNRLFDSLSTQVESNLDPFNDLSLKALISLVNHKLVNPSFSSSQQKILKGIIKKAFNQSLTSLSSQPDKDTLPIMQFLVHLLSRQKDLAKLLPENFLTNVLNHVLDRFVGPHSSGASILDRKTDHSEADNQSMSRVNMLRTLGDEIFRSIPTSELEATVNQIEDSLSDSSLDDTRFVNRITLLESLFVSDWSSSWPSKSVETEAKTTLMNEKLIDRLISNVHSALLDNSYLSSSSFQKLIIVIGLLKRLLHNGKLFVTAPRLYACIQCLLFKPLILMTSDPDNFLIIFLSILNFLNEVVSSYEYISNSCQVVFKDILYTLLKNLIMMSDQTKFTQFSPKARQDIVRAASEYHRIICQLTSAKEAFASEAPHLVVSYLVSSHRVTISPVVKSQLILAIYRLLNVIKSQTNWSEIYETIHCRLNESAREILKDLFENYEKYFIFKGRF